MRMSRAPSSEGHRLGFGNSGGPSPVELWLTTLGIERMAFGVLVHTRKAL